MGTTFWIFVGIALIQAVVGGLAKAAEKRKKREAEKARGASATDQGATSGATRKPSRVRSVSGAASRLEELERKRTEILARRTEKRKQREMAANSRRKAAAAGPPSGTDRTEDLRRKRIEELRRRTGATPGPTASAAPPQALAGVPPIVVSVPNPASEAPPASGRRRSTQATDAKPVTRSKTSSTARSTKRRPVSERGSLTDRMNRSRASKGGSKLKSAAKTIVPGNTTPSARWGGSSDGRSGRTSSTLAGRLRNRDQFQQAILMAELLQPPVGLRASSSGGGNV
ncbi:MAG: hypothetical protein P8J59_10670 [Phycisphaerales bacterium]|nr:hypothetical protein [Phycisphaerales bacterium]